MSEQRKTIGQIAFAAYWRATYPHQQVPAWDVIRPQFRVGWEAAATAVHQECLGIWARATKKERVES